MVTLRKTLKCKEKRDEHTFKRFQVAYFHLLPASTGQRNVIRTLKGILFTRELYIPLVYYHHISKYTRFLHTFHYATNGYTVVNTNLLNSFSVPSLNLTSSLFEVTLYLSASNSIVSPTFICFEVGNSPTPNGMAMPWSSDDALANTSLSE